MKSALLAAWRTLANLSRPGAAGNARRANERGERPDLFPVRDATEADIPALARLHDVTWNATYAPLGMKGPGVAIREQQWRDKFSHREPGWFCLVVQRPDGELVGFAEAKRSDHPDYRGELGKIYLLADYQRLGLGSRMLASVARRFLADGIDSMWLFGDARNPSSRAWIALGAHKTDADPGNGNYGWQDLRALIVRCAR